MSEKVIYARYRARASSKHRFFAFLTSPMDSPCKNTQDRGAPPRENFHVDKKKYSYCAYVLPFWAAVPKEPMTYAFTYGVVYPPSSPPT